LPLIAAIYYVQRALPIYTANAIIVIDPRLPTLLREQAGELNFSLDTAQLESQLTVLRSEKIATMVINQLNLAGGREPPPSADASGAAPHGASSHGANAAQAKAQEQPHEQTFFGSILASIYSIFGPEESKAPEDFERWRSVINRFLGGLLVRRIGLSHAIEISYSSPDPELAAQIANGVANAYLRDQVDTKAETARQASEWLEERISQLRKQLNAATHRVQEFRISHDYRISRNPQEQSPDGSDQPPRRTLEELETAAESYRKIYESYLQAFTAVVQRQSFPVADARIVTPATRPLGKSRPRTNLILAFAGVIGLIGGVGIGLVRLSLDHTIRSARQIRDELGFECLGIIPRVTVRKRSGLFDEVAKAPFSKFSTGLKGVKAAISLASRTKSMPPCPKRARAPFRATSPRCIRCPAREHWSSTPTCTVRR
jgi:uncharacterized protein involved in exopolysaccharide biosynthesis